MPSILDQLFLGGDVQTLRAWLTRVAMNEGNSSPLVQRPVITIPTDSPAYVELLDTWLVAHDGIAPPRREVHDFKQYHSQQEIVNRFNLLII